MHWIALYQEYEKHSSLLEGEVSSRWKKKLIDTAQLAKVHSLHSLHLSAPFWISYAYELEIVVGRFQTLDRKLGNAQPMRLSF